MPFGSCFFEARFTRLLRAAPERSSPQADTAELAACLADANNPLHIAEDCTDSPRLQNYYFNPGTAAAPTVHRARLGRRGFRGSPLRRCVRDPLPKCDRMTTPSRGDGRSPAWCAPP